MLIILSIFIKRFIKTIITRKAFVLNIYFNNILFSQDVDILSFQSDCVVNLLGAVPDYQGKCDQKTVNGLTFSSDRCGIFFNFTHWNETQEILVSGKSDQTVNVRPRIMILRMYVDERLGSDDTNLKFWNGYMLPDLKVGFH